MRRPGSLRRLLAKWLLGPLATLILLNATATYFVAIDAANDAYDSALLDPALAIASHLKVAEQRVRVDLPAEALDALRIDSVDRMYFQVLGPDNTRIAGNAAIPPPPRSIAAHFLDRTYYNSEVEGGRVRVAALSVPHREGRVIVQVAETLIKRERLITEMLLSSLLPQILVAFAAVALSWYGIKRGLSPLEELRDEVASRSPVDLRPVAEHDKPQEIRPLVAALNQLLERLNAAIDAERRFIANAAHQLRTPLAGLKTHAALARRGAGEKDLPVLLEMIGTETERTSHLVNQLLTLARAEPGAGTELAHEPINLHVLGSRAAQEWVPRAIAGNIDLGFELEDAWTTGDALLLRELIGNLLDNAIAYTGSGGAVTLRTRANSDIAVLEVEDSGPGIPPSERQRVFERFYRIAGTRGDGCGLGLAIVAEIAARHGARVDILTPRGGLGTAVQVVFPRLANFGTVAAKG